MKSRILLIALLFASTFAIKSTTTEAASPPLGMLDEAATAHEVAVRISPPPPPLDPNDVPGIIRAVWPDDLENWALRIAYRESRYQPRVHTWCCHGIFQIHRDHLPWLCDLGIACTIEDLYDPITNVRAAYTLYQRDGKAPWR